MGSRGDAGWAGSRVAWRLWSPCTARGLLILFRVFFFTVLLPCIKVTIALFPPLKVRTSVTYVQAWENQETNIYNLDCRRTNSEYGNPYMMYVIDKSVISAKKNILN